MMTSNGEHLVKWVLRVAAGLAILTVGGVGAYLFSHTLRDAHAVAGEQIESLEDAVISIDAKVDEIIPVLKTQTAILERVERRLDAP